MTKILVSIDKLLNIKKGAITITMCTTEDKAIITLISVFVTQTTLTIILPKILNEIIKSIKVSGEIKGINRIRPIPPNFRRIPASSIDP